MVLNGLADENSYVVRLGSLVYLNRLEEAERIFAEHGQLYAHSEIACNTIIHGYLLSGKLDAAIKVLDSMFAQPEGPGRPNRVTASTFVNYFYVSGDLSQATGLLQRFAAIGFPSQQEDFAELIKLYSRFDANKACQMVGELVKTHEKLHIQVYNSLLTALCDRKVNSEWKRLFARPLITLKGINPNGLAAIAMNAPEETRQVIVHMEANKVAPTSVTYDLIMRSLRGRFDSEALVRVYEYMSRESGLAQYSSHHNAYMEALLRLGDRSAVDRFLRTCQERRLLLNTNNIAALEQAGFQIPTFMVRRAVRVNSASRMSASNATLANTENVNRSNGHMNRGESFSNNNNNGTITGNYEGDYNRSRR